MPSRSRKRKSDEVDNDEAPVIKQARVKDVEDGDGDAKIPDSTDKPGSRCVEPCVVRSPDRRGSEGRIDQTEFWRENESGETSGKRRDHQGSLSFPVLEIGDGPSSSSSSTDDSQGPETPEADDSRAASSLESCTPRRRDVSSFDVESAGLLSVERPSTAASGDDSASTCSSDSNADFIPSESDLSARLSVNADAETSGDETSFMKSADLSIDFSDDEDSAIVGTNSGHENSESNLVRFQDKVHAPGIAKQEVDPSEGCNGAGQYKETADPDASALSRKEDLDQSEEPNPDVHRAEGFTSTVKSGIRRVLPTFVGKYIFD